jgi:hypothetical protein
MIEDRGSYIFVKFNEPFQLDRLLKLMDEVAEACRETGCGKVLVDLREMPGRISAMDRFQMGVYGSKLFQKLAKVAVVYRKEEINRFAETVGMNRGLHARIFSDIEEARAWL